MTEPEFSAGFKAFARWGDPKAEGTHISLSQSDKWMKQAGVIDPKLRISTTDTAIHFKKLKSLKVKEADYLRFLEDLAKAKKLDLEEIKKKMAGCSQPGATTSSLAEVGGKAAGAVDRLTDASKYTGSHKQRFDEAGRGRGIAGRKETPDTSGYVSGYVNKDTYDKAH